MEPITFGGIIAFVIFVITVVSIARNPNHGFLGKTIWIIVAFVLPVLGAILWMIFGRGRVPKR
jgi:hypothetical protein